jgi:hypothetical protein
LTLITKLLMAIAGICMLPVLERSVNWQKYSLR